MLPYAAVKKVFYNDLIVNSPVINVQPNTNSTVTLGNINRTLSVTASAAQGMTLGYQWYSNTINSNSGGTPISGSNGLGYDLPSTLTIGTYYYYCVVSTMNGMLSKTSNIATITVIEPGPPVISINTQPAATTIVTQGNISGSLLVSASVTQNATLSYLWYSNTINSNSGGTSISGSTGAYFTIPTNLIGGTYFYYCVVSASGGASSVTSNTAMVKVKDGDAINWDPTFDGPLTLDGDIDIVEEEHIIVSNQTVIAGLEVNSESGIAFDVYDEWENYLGTLYPYDTEPLIFVMEENVRYLVICYPFRGNGYYSAILSITEPNKSFFWSPSKEGSLNIDALTGHSPVYSITSDKTITVNLNTFLNAKNDTFNYVVYDEKGRMVTSYWSVSLRESINDLLTNRSDLWLNDISGQADRSSTDDQIRSFVNEQRTLQRGDNIAHATFEMEADSKYTICVYYPSYDGETPYLLTFSE
jgi:hypothetical protein